MTTITVHANLSTISYTTLQNIRLIEKHTNLIHRRLVPKFHTFDIGTVCRVSRHVKIGYIDFDYRWPIFYSVFCQNNPNAA